MVIPYLINSNRIKSSLFFTARCTLVQSAVLRLHDVRLSVRQSVIIIIIIIIIVINIHLYTATYRKTRTVAVGPIPYELKWGIKSIMVVKMSVCDVNWWIRIT